MATWSCVDTSGKDMQFWFFHTDGRRRLFFMEVAKHGNHMKVRCGDTLSSSKITKLMYFVSNEFENFVLEFLCS
jgi:hypothetical protein